MGAGFRSIGIAATHTSKALNRFGEKVGLIYDGNARPLGRPGSAVLFVDPGSGDPSQMGVEAVRSPHSVAEKVDAMAARMGFTLASWQRDLAIDTLTDQPRLIEAPRGAGKVIVQQVIDGVRADLAWVDEVR
ncbi:hypothetical protein SEA_MARCIE_51 [Microbacterium phage Marcie]|nr:hypothetical protein SEA_MARCIE_51 [Microbacterium phage Marcie]